MCGDASERTRERLVTVVRTPRRHIYVRATRKQRPPVCFASNHEGFRTFPHWTHGFQVPRNRALPKGFPRSSQLPPSSERFDPPRAISSSKEVGPSSSHSATPTRSAVASSRWPPANGILSSFRLRKVQSPTILYHLSTISLLIDRIFNSFPRDVFKLLRTISLSKELNFLANYLFPETALPSSSRFIFFDPSLLTNGVLPHLLSNKFLSSSDHFLPFLS